MKGELVVWPLTDFPDRFLKLKTVFLDEVNNSYDIMSVRFHKSEVWISFVGVDTRTDAERLAGKMLLISEQDLIELPDATYFQFDVAGMSVYTEDGQYLGEVKEILEMPANDVWRVVGEKEFLLPATRNVVLAVDREKRLVTIRMIEGLMDIR